MIKRRIKKHNYHHERRVTSLTDSRGALVGVDPLYPGATPAEFLINPLAARIMASR